MTSPGGTEQQLCDITLDSKGATVQLERNVTAAPDSVWQALTDADELSRWLAPAAFDPRFGGTVEIRFDADQIVSGEITVFEPPVTLEYTWRIAGEANTVVRFWLVPTGTGTTVRITHRRLPVSMAAGYGAGWHAHGDRLAAFAQNTEMPDWDTRFSHVLPRYIEVLSP